MKKIYTFFERLTTKKLAVLFLFFGFFISNAQVTTNSGSGLAASYPDLATAITALNGATITSPVVITLTGNETAPAGGYSITAQGTVANTIIIEGVTSTITANAALTVGNLNDAIFKLVGADYITIRNFTMLENAANTTTAAATNNMTEWGIALLYATTTNGAQNNTLQGNIIDLNRTYQNTFGIYSNSTHSNGAPTTTATATTTAGANSGLKVYGNSITDVNIGILVVGPTAAADNNDGVDIGGTSLATGNIITNYGTTGTFSAFANVSGTVNGILLRNSKNFNVSYNTVTSSNGGITAGTSRGIFIPAFSNAPTGTIVNFINNNVISVRPGASVTISCIEVAATTNSATTTLNINNNDFNNIGHTVAATNAITLINNLSTSQITNINSNTFTNLTVNTTGNFTFISNSVTHTTGSVTNVSNNSVVTAFSKTGAGGTVYFYDAFGGTIGGAETNTGNNFSNITLTGATTLGGFRTADGAAPYPAKTVTNNTFTNISNGAGSMIILNVGYSTVGSSNNVTNNIIRNISGANSIVGITSAAGDQAFSSNEVSGLNTTGANSASGISITGGTTQSISKNKIFDIQSNNAGGTVNGILVSAGTTNNLFNNIIGDLRTPLANAANPLVGINITGGTTANVSYNTVMLNGVSAGALFGSSAISVSTTPTVALRNNIFVNNSSVTGAGLAAAYRRSSTTLTSYAAASNNNLFYASTIFYDGTNTDATLAAFKTRVGSRDINSVSENPNFVSTIGSNVNFLHINTGIPTQIESGAATIAGITVDFDDDVRNVSTPDIGADEFAGILLDLIAPSISYTPLSVTCDGSVNRTLTATITDASGVSTSGVGLPVLYWRINAGAWNNVTGTFVSGSTYTFVFGAGAVTSDVVSYYIVAQDNAGSPNVGAFPSAGAAGFTINPPAASTSPTTPSSYTISNTLTGVYTVGTTGNFTTLTAAVSAYNSGCMAGPVTFSLTDATYPSETFPIIINQNANASSVNTLTIKPAVGVVSTISGSINGAIFVLNGADYVNIDGSSTLGSAAACLVGGDATLRELTFQNTNTGTSAAVISVQSGTNGAQNNVIKNINVIGQDPTTTLLGISLGGNTPGTAGTDNDNNIVENCSVQRSIFGIYSAGQNLANQNSGTIIKQNNLSATGANRIRRVGVALFNENNANVSYNNIGGIDNSGESADPIGIALGLQNVFNTTVAAGGITNASVTNNRINGVANDATFSASGIAIAGDVGGANTISNNMISNVISDGNSGDFVAGIFVAGAVGSNTRLYNNTVDMSGDRSALLTPGTAMYPSYGVAITGTDPTVDMRNNIFNTSQTAAIGANPDAKCFAVGTTSTTFVNLNSNYNNYFSTGVQDGGFRSGSLNTAAGTSYATLALWAAAVADDANSVEIAPVFTSATDLHLVPLSNATLDNLGTPIAAVTTDYDCAVRSLTTPDMGADEFCSPTTNVTDVTVCDTYTWAVNGTTYTTSGTYTNLVGCHTEVLNLIINITPNADAPANVTACDSYTLPALTVGNYFTGVGGTGTALVAGNTITSSQTIYVYAQTGTTPNCTDENSFTVTINTTPVADAPANVTACDSFTLPALTVGNYFTGIGGTGTALVAGNTITSSQTVYVYAQTGTTPNCTDENSFTVTINNTPNADAPANVTACDSYTLPALTVGNYFTGAGGTGTALVAGNTITSSQTIYVYAQTGTTPNCTDENSFTVTINTSPVADAPANVTACDSYTLPALTVGNYFTGAGGTGTALVAGNTITSSQTIYVYAQTGTTPNCTDENSFTVTINNSPVADAPANATACDSYTLPALTVGNYFTGAGGTGTALVAGNTITSSQTIYVYAQTGTTPNCTDENSFTVTITTSTSNSTTTSACNSYTWAVNGTTYTTGGTYTNVVGCHTETLNLTITTTTTPTGASTQVINGGVAADVTIEDIVVTGTGIIWYPTALDAANNTNAIPAGTQLVDGEDYFAVSQNGICYSAALQVTVTVVLGNASFDLSQLTYYPNPVKDIFNVKYSKEIISVDVYDLTGRKVIEMKPNTLEVQLNMTNLSSAMYIVKLKSVDGITELKVYKN